MPVSAVPVPDENSSFLRSCLVEGDSAQEARVRRNKRRALFASIVVQILFLTALVLFPLFSKGENIASRAVLVPAVPYSPGRAPQHPRTPSQPPHGRPDPCRFCAPRRISPTIVTNDPDRPGDPTAPVGPDIPGAPDGQNIPGLFPSSDSHPAPPPPQPVHPRERRMVSGQVEAAMLIRRVQPIYPPLAIPIRREGTVELHAIIATDGTIQSLEVISGDPLFVQSALAAVREWRYRPTILNGQPIEVDTQITVIYTLTH
jgi:periplasmic protein TonB